MKQMKQIISHESALEYWRRHLKLPGNSTDRRCKADLPCEPLIIVPAIYSEFSLPVHILIGDRGARQVSRVVEQHLFSGKTPIGCFMNIGDRLMVCSPEFCYLQMATRLPLVDLIELGYELCSEYSLPLRGDLNVPKEGFYKRDSLTSVRKLGGFLGSMPGTKGHKKALYALRFLCGGAASPMETKLAIFLTLPHMLGGFGFDLPELNKRIDLTSAERRKYGKDFYVCDIFWADKKIAVEYDSDQQHTGSDRIASDSIRRNILESSGIKVVTITKQQLYSSMELTRAAQSIATHMGRRLFSRKSGFYSKHHELRKQLLKYS